MGSFNFRRLLVVHFHLWYSNPWSWVGEKRRQLFHRDPSVHCLLWDIQALRLLLPMFVLPSVHLTATNY